MPALITGKYTRAELEMRAPLSRSLSIRPQDGGSTLHWGGPGSTINGHGACIAVWKGWQDFHMGPERGWVDIAYTMGFCQHGWVFPGRGYGVRTAAQGTNDGNDRSYAFCHINQNGKDPSAAALSAAAWLVQDARTNGRAGQQVWAHWDWHETDCPGSVVATLAHSLDRRAVPSGSYTPAPSATSGGDDVPLNPDDLKAIQKAVLYYEQDAAHVNPLTMIQRTYDLAVKQDGVLKAIQQAGAGQVVDIPSLAAAIVKGLPHEVALQIDPQELASAVADKLAVRLKE